MEEKKRLQYLLNRYVTGACTPAEEEEFMQLVAASAQDDEVKAYLAEAWHQLPTNRQLPDNASQRIYAEIVSPEASVVDLPAASRPKKWLWAAAAMVLLTGSIAVFIARNARSSQPVAAKQKAATPPADVAPGTDGAVLTLADGSTIVLDNAANGTLGQQGNSNIIKKDGRISYVSKGGQLLPAGFNTIGTARGKQFQLVLEDGTKVWLNAASSIRYPVVFADSAREVEITGEAYFDVAADKKKPFRVKANGSTVDVLGTQFNINAYTNEPSAKTTLIAGAVNVKNGNSRQLLKPGQQAVVKNDGSIKLCENVNLGEITAWKNNMFSFNNTELSKLMRQLERWYDVTVVFADSNDSGLRLNGDISRTANLSTVLKMLELTGEVHFTIKDKTIMVN